MKVHGALTFAAFLLASAASVAWAQDPPSRVARLSYISGSVSMQPAGVDAWTEAVVNRPLTTGDYIWADTNSRAELHLNESVMRISSETSFGFLNLSDRITQVRLAQGELYVHLSRLSEDETYEVDTPNGAITLLRNGDYRINVDSNNQSSFVVVRHGQAEVTGGGQAFNLIAGESAQLSGTDTLAYDVQEAPQIDSFEDFCQQRDAADARAAAEARYVPNDMIGYEDLYGQGSWRTVPEYGNVWYPQVAPGWAPYHYGHWAWIEPWGWTWIDNAPWGFAPFHYGRWAYLGGGWCWNPGPIAREGVGYARPVYAPALVAFVGGPHFSISASFGGAPSVGWVPLGPGELYTPAYHVSPAYFRQVNVSNTVINKTVNVTNVYNNTYVNNTVNNSVHNTNVTNQRFVNAHAPGAFTAMPQSAFASGRPVASAGQSVPPAQAVRLQSAPVMVAPAVAPTRQALAPMGTSAAVAHPPARVIERPVVVRTAPPPPPSSFAAKQPFLQKNLGRPLNMQAFRQAAPPRQANALVRPAIPASAAGARIQQVQVAPGSRSNMQQVREQPRENQPRNPSGQQGVQPNVPNANVRNERNYNAPQPVQPNVERPAVQGNFPHPPGAMAGRGQNQGEQAQPRGQQRQPEPQRITPRANVPEPAHPQGQPNVHRPEADQVRRPSANMNNENNRPRPREEQKPQHSREPEQHP